MPRSSRRSNVAKPHGSLAPLVQAVGPDRFAVLCFDCGKHASKLALFDFYGSFLLTPFYVHHDSHQLDQAIARVRSSFSQFGIRDHVVALETTGTYHGFIVNHIRRREPAWNIRFVHPHSSRHFRLPADPGIKTDDTDLAAIFRATCQGFGLTPPVWTETYEQLRLLRRHRRDLVDKRACLQKQIRETLHLLLPNFAELFHDLWESDAPLALARQFGSAQRILQLGVEGLRSWARDLKIRMLDSTFRKILLWAQSAPPADPFADSRRLRLESLTGDHLAKSKEIASLELATTRLLAKTSYILLLAIPGINAVSAADLAGELGPMHLYPNPNSITGRAGLLPCRYQSADVDRANGPLTPRGNRRIRNVLIQAGQNLAQCNNHFKAKAIIYKSQGKSSLAQAIKIAKTFSRIAYHLTTTKDFFAHPCLCEPSNLLPKLAQFLLDHEAEPACVREVLEDTLTHLNAQWARREEKPLEDLVDIVNRKRKPGPQKIGPTIALILARLKLIQSPEGGTPSA